MGKGSKCDSVLIVSFLALMAISSSGFADETDSDSKIVYEFWKCTSPTNGFWGLKAAHSLCMAGVR